MLENSRKKRILVVDDDVSVRRVHSRVLAFLGKYEVEEADSGPAAIDMVEAALKDGINGPYDLVLTDFHMPVMTGAGLVRELRARNHGVPVVLVSGDAGHDDLRGLAGISAFLRKPASNEMLLAAVRGVLD